MLREALGLFTKEYPAGGAHAAVIDPELYPRRASEALASPSPRVAQIEAVLEAAKASACRDYLPSDLWECLDCPCACDEPNTPACQNLAKAVHTLEGGK